MSYAWGGFQNGQIPSSAMAIIPGTAQFIKKELLPGVVALRDAFRAHFGYTLAITEAYRSLAVQQSLYAGWVARKPGYNLAAVPGTSMHGWGLSIDFGSNVDSYGSAEKQWMDANAPRYGFNPTGNDFSPREAWHFDGTGTNTSGGNATPINEEDDMPSMEEFLNTPAFTGGPTISQAIKDLYYAQFYGLPAMKDGGKSVSQSLAEINKAVNTPVVRDGKSVPQIQDNADTGTLVRKLLANPKN